MSYTSFPGFLLDGVPNAKVDILKNSGNLDFELTQPDGQRAAAVTVRVNNLAILFAVIVFQRADQAEKIIEHRKREPIRFAFYSPIGCRQKLPGIPAPIIFRS
jgi:hypothetical protein